MGNYYGDTNKWFVGFVTEVIDEAYVRVRIFGIHNIEDRTRLPDQDLPPALVSYPTTGGQSGSGAPTHNLTVDSWVHGFFADGDDCQFPVVTGVINGSHYSMSTYKSDGGAFVGQPVGTTANVNTTNGEVDTTATTNIPGGSNVEKVYNYAFDRLTREGDKEPHLHTSALVGTLQLESSPSINPDITNPSSGAYGICQWLSSNRKADMRRITGSSRPSLAQQLDFMWWELNNTEKGAKRQWLASTNLPDAVAGFCWYERAEETLGGRLNRNHKNYKIRLQYAYKIFNSMKFTG